jgi:hypothetical protein
MKEDAFADSEAAEACCCCSRLRNFDSALLISNGADRKLYSRSAAQGGDQLRGNSCRDTFAVEALIAGVPID